MLFKCTSVLWNRQRDKWDLWINSVLVGTKTPTLELLQPTRKVNEILIDDLRVLHSHKFLLQITQMNNMYDCNNMLFI
jgi:hypothetical protein